MTNNLPPEVRQQLFQTVAEMHRKDELKKQNEERVDFIIKFLTAAYDKAAAYTNLILVAGYAAIFTLWGNVKPFITQGEALWSALFILFSLFVFILWEIASMIFNARNLAETSSALKVPIEEFGTVLDKITKEQNQKMIRYKRFWIAVLMLTILPAIIGASILFRGFIRQLF